MTNDGRQESSGSGVSADPQSLSEFQTAAQKLRAELARVIVGQDEVVDQLLIAMFANGHCILEGVPGLAKTLMISTLARCLALSFSRIQFTPDLMPSDITGTEVIQEDRSTGKRELRFIAGPIFANVILADEINRTPPKTQAALLEAMQERHVTVGRVRHDLDAPFFVLATQNPIEQEGTYPLPEAQQDRFLFKVLIGYPSYDEEYLVAERTTSPGTATLKPIVTQEECLKYQQLIRAVPAAPDVIHYALQLVRATRPGEATAPPAVRSMITWGAGPRAVQALILGGKVRAAMNNRHHVAIDDVRALSHPVLRHRLVTNFSAEAEGYTTDRVIDELLSAVNPHETPFDRDHRLRKVLSS
jgi:MoxR-like ATPase